ncbi:MAG: hypothetical protein AAGD14_06190 [Planctomycetota bacterium]
MTRARLFVLVWILAACAEPVREDRTIAWSAQGHAVGFQHGDNGVFLADADGGKLERIFEPGEKVIATSTPLWSPAGDAVVFAAARSLEPSGGHPRLQRILGLASDPAGDYFLQVPVVYTCYLRRGDEQPVALFQASCDHVGYVAANLAVQWHPDGRQVYFLNGRELHTFELATEIRAKVFGRGSDAMIFDVSADGRLLCLAGSREAKTQDGLWVRGTEGDWWRVPVALGPGASLLERLRAARPAVSPDGSRFAFVNAGTQLTIGSFQGRAVQRAAETEGAMRDLRWHPDGERIGLVVEHDLHFFHPKTGLGEPVSDAPVTRFAGWNATGRRHAYLARETPRVEPMECWAFLLWPDPQARNTVHIDGQQRFAGMRVTFPEWSPRDDKLSLWFTFHPTHRSALSRMFGWGLRPGDPAAIFEPDTGTISWMAVNPLEEVQIGHYHLLRREPQKAWARYEKAAAGETDVPGHPRDFPLFLSICLRELGREEEAQEALARFQREFVPASEGARGPVPGPESFDLSTFEGKLVRALYAGEVFLSLDRIEEGEAYFRAPTDDPDTRLARRIVLGQFLLLQKRYAEYAELAGDGARSLMTREAAEGSWGGMLLDGARFLHFAPLTSQDFLSKLDDETVQRLQRIWKRLPNREAYRSAFARRLDPDAAGDAPEGFPSIEQLRMMMSATW